MRGRGLAALTEAQLREAAGAQGIDVDGKSRRELVTALAALLAPPPAPEPGQPQAIPATPTPPRPAPRWYDGARAVGERARTEGALEREVIDLVGERGPITLEDLAAAVGVDVPRVRRIAGRFESAGRLAHTPGGVTAL